MWLDVKVIGRVVQEAEEPEKISGEKVAWISTIGRWFGFKCGNAVPFFITRCSLNSRHNNTYFPCSKTRRGFAVARWPVFGTQMGDFCGDGWADARKSESQLGA